MSIEIYNNYYTEELFKKVRENAESSMKEDKFSVSNFLWQEAIVRLSPPVLIYDIGVQNNELFQELVQYDKDNLDLGISDPDNYTFSKMIYFWTNGSYIPWHNDQKFVWVGTTHLNDVWDEFWGGHFMYKEDDKINAILPERNKLVVQKVPNTDDGLEHCTVETKIGVPYRVTLQSFISHKDDNVKY